MIINTGLDNGLVQVDNTVSSESILTKFYKAEWRPSGNSSMPCGEYTRQWNKPDMPMIMAYCPFDNTLLFEPMLANN